MVVRPVPSRGERHILRSTNAQKKITFIIFLMTNFRPFDREKAFALIPSMLQVGLPPEVAITASIEVAQEFENEMRKHVETVPFPKAVALQSFGQYIPNGTSLYFQTYDGSQFLIAEFATIEECVAVAIAKGSFLPKSNWGAA